MQFIVINFCCNSNNISKRYLCFVKSYLISIALLPFAFKVVEFVIVDHLLLIKLSYLLICFCKEHIYCKN